MLYCRCRGAGEEQELLVHPCLYCFVFLLFVMVHEFACSSKWIFLFFSVPVPRRSHTVTFGGLTLLSPVYTLPLPCVPQWVMHAMCHVCTFNESAARGSKKKKDFDTSTWFHGNNEALRVRREIDKGKHPPPHPSCDFQLLALRCCWRLLLCVRAKYYGWAGAQTSMELTSPLHTCLLVEI